MIKKLFSTVLLSLLCGGILRIQYTSAMEYTISGPTASISIPRDTSNGINIRRWDSQDITKVSEHCWDPHRLDSINLWVYTCSHTYDVNGDHTIQILNYWDSRVVTMYLNNSNITRIFNFDWFNNLNTIYLADNHIEQLTGNILGWLWNGYTLDLSYNWIYNFSLPTNDIKILYLNNNELTKIPDSIRNNRNSFEIKLSDSIKYWDSSKPKFVDLSNNRITFIWITEVWNQDTYNNYSSYNFHNTTTYNFERFWYQQNTWTDCGILYNYYIKQNEENIVNWRRWICATGGTTWVTITTPLRPWNYTFQVCEDTDVTCDSIDFNVSYDVWIEITTPSQDQEIDNVNDAVFQRRKTGQYPDQFLSWYEYELKFNNNVISWWVISNTSFMIPSDLIQQYWDWSYTLFVYLLDSDWNKIYHDWQWISDWSSYWNQVYDTATYTINTIPDQQDQSGNKVEINRPNDWKITSQPYTFSWTPTITSDFEIDTYEYKLMQWSTQITWWNKDITSFSQNGLANWEYTLTVTMHYHQKNHSAYVWSTSDTKTFTVKKDTSWATLNITKPFSTDNQKLESLSWTFARSWSAWTNYELSWYTYSVKEAWTNWATITWWSTKTNTSFTLNNLEHWKAYIFTVNMHAKEDNSIIKTEPRTFSVALKNTTYLTITSPTWTWTSKTWTFSRNGDADPNYHTFWSYHYTLTSDKWYNYSWDSTKKSDSFNLSDLVSGKYTFNVKMLSSTWALITLATRIFDVKIPQTLTITNPSSGASLSSSSTTFNWSVYNDTITNPVYLYSLSWPTTYSWTTTATSLSYNWLKNWNYSLNVKMLSWSDTVAQNTVSFTVSIKSSWWGGGSSGWGRRTNNLSIKINDSNPTTNQRVWATITIDDNYRWKVTFTKIQYRDSSADKWVDAPLTSSNYVSDSSDDAKLGYYNITSSDNGKKVLSDFLKFKKNGNYRIYVEDKDWYTDYVQFYIWNGKVEPVPTPASDEERYIARSCKKYKLTYNNSLNVRTSPNLKKNEYFVTTDYFKRYIDSKNAQIDGCPTNDPRISTTYKDTTNRDDKYTAPNGKVYFINNKNWKYQSDELDYPSMLFSTLSEIKYYIRDRNPFINMAWTK